ncbi:dUTP diphosphatase [Lysinibacillus sp. TE18511]
MNLKKLFEAQEKLDEHILKQHNLQYVELPKVILSLLTELSEVANDWQGFKYWKVNNAQKDTTLEEIADVTHFLASLSNRFKVTEEDINGLGAVRYTDVSTHFIAMHHAASFIAMYPNANKKREHVLSLWKLFKGLIENLGFTWEQVEETYYTKNQINYARQVNGY